MRQALISDLHSNIQALEAVLADIDKQKCDTIFCLGDLVNYGANPNEVIALLIERGISSLLGNHEAFVLKKLKDPNYNMDLFNLSNKKIKLSIEYTLRTITEQSKAYLLNIIDPLIVENGVTYAHASPRPGKENEEYLFSDLVSKPSVAQGVFDSFDKLCFVGHTHIPGIFLEKAGMFSFQHTEWEDHQVCSISGKTLFTVGSVGQPRNYDTRASYVIYDDKENTLEFRRVEYDVQKASDAIRKAGLPTRHAERLHNGE